MILKNSEIQGLTKSCTLMMCLLFSHQYTYCADGDDIIEEESIVYTKGQKIKEDLKNIIYKSSSNFDIYLSDQAIDKLTESVGKFELSTLSFSRNKFNKDGAIEWYHNIRNMSKVFYNVLTEHKHYDNKTAVRASINITHQIVSWWISRTNYTLVHEVSHAQAVKEFGGRNITFWVGNKQYKTVGEFYLAFMGTYNRGAVSYEFPSDEIISPQQEAVISAAGINAQLNIAEDIAQESQVNQYFDQSDALHYILNKVVSTVYYNYDSDSSSSDLAHYADALYKQGVIQSHEISKTKEYISNISFLATLLSGRTWEAINAISNEIALNHSTSATYRFKTPLGVFSWPEFTAFLNESSITFKTSTSFYTDKSTTYQLSYETSVLGQEINEVGLGATYRYDEWETTLKGYFNDRDGRGLYIRSKYDVGSRNGFSFFAEARFDNGTLDQRRRQYSLTEQENNSFEASFKLGLEYKF